MPLHGGSLERVCNLRHLSSESPDSADATITPACGSQVHSVFHASLPRLRNGMGCVPCICYINIYEHLLCDGHNDITRYSLNWGGEPFSWAGVNASSVSCDIHFYVIQETNE